MRGWAILALLTGCFTTAPSDEAPDTVVDAQRGVCRAFDGATFESLEKQTCPNGPCFWRIELGRRSFQWKYADIEETGVVTCTGRKLSMIGADDRRLTGSYDPATGQLTWDGRVYIRAN